ncbi:hypothetical protein [Edaphocola flava]|uniref:hypothetical protein n=1 Tax=Edaphocola flava TaxID=2499629 RepID=UPI0013871B96|nr:hypothetical protein [Edaphocola flava]
MRKYIKSFKEHIEYSSPDSVKPIKSEEKLKQKMKEEKEEVDNEIKILKKLKEEE